MACPMRYGAALVGGAAAAAAPLAVGAIPACHRVHCLLWTGAAVGAGILLGRRFFATKASAPEPRGAFVYVVTLKMKPNTRPLFLKEWTTLAEYVKANEPNTLTYEAVVSKEDPDKLLIYERYVSRSDLADVHAQSAAIKKFGEIAGQYVAEKTIDEYYETNIGFMSK